MNYVDAVNIPGVVIIDNAAYCEVGGRYYPVIGVLRDGRGGYIPVPNIPQMSDERLRELSKQHPVPKGVAV